MHRTGGELSARAGILSRRALIAVVLAAGLSSVVGQTTADDEGVSADEFVNALPDGVAMDGFDVVAYFDGAPARGLASHSVEHKGKSWLFSSAENAAAFAANPGAYEPRYNGWCAYAASGRLRCRGRFRERLVCARRQALPELGCRNRAAFLSDQSTRIERAEMNWPDLHAAMLDGSAAMYTHAGEGVAIVHPQQLE